MRARAHTHTHKTNTQNTHTVCVCGVYVVCVGEEGGGFMQNMYLRRGKARQNNIKKYLMNKMLEYAEQCSYIFSLNHIVDK